jgi:hypothetical protein
METKIHPEPKTDVYLRTRTLRAFLMGLPSFLLIFFLGEKFVYSLNHGGAVYIWGSFLVGGIGAYFLILSYLLSRGNPRAVRKGWPIILALNITPLFMLLMTVFLERQLGPVLSALGLVMFTVLSSFAGATLAQLVARRRLRIKQPTSHSKE